jgi:hypothetical protein
VPEEVVAEGGDGVRQVVAFCFTIVIDAEDRPRPVERRQGIPKHVNFHTVDLDLDQDLPFDRCRLDVLNDSSTIRSKGCPRCAD